MNRQDQGYWSDKAKKILLALFLATCAAYAQTPTTGPATQGVAEIRIEGNKQVEKSVILNLIKMRVAQPYDESLAKADVQRLLASGRFERVEASETKTDKGWVVTFKVVERSLVNKLVFQGNKAIKTEDIRPLVQFGGSDPLNLFSVESGRQAILNKYHNEGFYFATVTYDGEALKNNREVIYKIVEGNKAYVRKMIFEGNNYYSNMSLRFRISSAIRFWPFTEGTLDREQVDRDISTIRGLYVGEGFLDVEVDCMPIFTNDNNDVVLKFIIRENDRYRVGSVKFNGNVVFSSEVLLGRIHLKPGEYLTAQQMKRDNDSVQNTYGEMGYIDAHVVPRKVFKEKPGTVDLVFDITESDQYHIGKIDIRGNTLTKTRVIRRELRFFPEQLFNTVAADESKKRLMETQLFEDVNISPVGNDAKVRDALVTVKEGKTAQFLIGVGVSSSFGLGGRIQFTQHNFDIGAWPRNWEEFSQGKSFKGAGQTLTISAEPGTQISNASIGWFEPYLFDQPYSLGNKLYYFTANRVDNDGDTRYDESRVGDVVSFGHRFKNRWYGEISTRIEEVDIHNLADDVAPEIRADQGTHLIMGPKLTIIRDTTDSRMNPTQGDRLQLSYEQIFGDYSFGKAYADYRIYHTVYVDVLDRKHVLAGRVNAGQIFGDAPVFEKFYAGGMGSVRGFKYRGISPRGGVQNDAIGGNFILLASGEYVFPLIGEVVHGVLFSDTGTVESDTTITSYRSSIGVGVRVIIPFFGPIPMDFDFAAPVSKYTNDETEWFSFSMGWSF